MTTPAFTVRFLCANCGKRWQESFERGDRLDGTYLHSHACTLLQSCSACHAIECPCCASERDVQVTKREPSSTEGVSLP